MFTIFTTIESAKFEDILRHVENENKYRDEYAPVNSPRKAMSILQSLPGAAVALLNTVMRKTVLAK